MPGDFRLPVGLCYINFKLESISRRECSVRSACQVDPRLFYHISCPAPAPDPFLPPFHPLFRSRSQTVANPRPIKLTNSVNPASTIAFLSSSKYSPLLGFRLRISVMVLVLLDPPTKHIWSPARMRGELRMYDWCVGVTFKRLARR